MTRKQLCALIVKMYPSFYTAFGTSVPRAYKISDFHPDDLPPNGFFTFWYGTIGDEHYRRLPLHMLNRLPAARLADFIVRNWDAYVLNVKLEHMADVSNEDLSSFAWCISCLESTLPSTNCV